ncbi:MAG TPA: hypothetical protein VJ765_10655 [Chitinophagaceae bacterium]|nr:hypothetical protein [Chitinophagaceae bacterium]
MAIRAEGELVIEIHLTDGREFKFDATHIKDLCLRLSDGTGVNKNLSLLKDEIKKEYKDAANFLQQVVSQKPAAI